ncbi:MAG: thermonuclease family protein [Candidatus Nanopelagicales bacterium]
MVSRGQMTGGGGGRRAAFVVGASVVAAVLGLMLLIGLARASDSGPAQPVAAASSSSAAESARGDGATPDAVTPAGSAPAVDAAVTPAPAVPPADVPTAPAVPAAPVVPSPVKPSPVATPAPQTGQSVAVVDVVDGDTIVTSAGRIRMIGIDTPEVGDCNYRAAGDELQGAISAHGNQVVLVPGAQDDVDKYGRLLRYVQTTDGADLNLHMISTGLAIARYDSRDGYGFHPRESAYIAADYSSDASACALSPTPTPTPTPTVAQQQPLLGAEAALDPKFSSCAAAKRAGFGPYLAGVNPEYSWYKDADGDGRVCES